MSGKLVYWVPDGGSRFRSLMLTVCSESDCAGGGLVELRRKRLSRIITEAASQGARLGYKDLSVIMLTSKATLKRDISYLRAQGIDVPMGGRGGAGL